MMKINIAISTVPRATTHIHDMIQQLKDEGFFNDPAVAQFIKHPLRLVAGSSDVQYLERYRDGYDIVVDYMTSAEAIMVESFKKLEQRVAFNAARCLGGLAKECDYVLMLQDDGRFAKGWLPRLRATVEDAKNRLGEWWCLTLFAFTDVPLPMPQDSRLWSHLVARGFIGGHALLFPTGAAHEFAKMLVANCFSDPPQYDDMLLRVFAAKTGIKLLASVPSLVQHMGRQSTLGNPFFETAWFRESV